MKAYEFPTKVTPDGTLEVPIELRGLLQSDQAVRVILLMREPAEERERVDWSRLTAEQFMAGYGEADAIYDRA